MMRRTDRRLQSQTRRKAIRSLAPVRTAFALHLIKPSSGPAAKPKNSRDFPRGFARNHGSSLILRRESKNASGPTQGARKRALKRSALKAKRQRKKRERDRDRISLTFHANRGLAPARSAAGSRRRGRGVHVARRRGRTWVARRRITSRRKAGST